MEAEAADNVRFYTRPVMDPELTKKEGRTTHRDAIYVEVCNPGDRSNIIDRPMRESDKVRYPLRWAAFQNNASTDVVIGTRLSAWGLLPPSRVEDLRYQRILTVEQLAAVPDSALGSLGIDGRTVRQAAINFLEGAKSAAPVMRLEAELESERAQRRALENALKEQGDRLEALAAGKNISVEAVREVPAPVQAAPRAKSRTRKAVQAQ